MNLIRMMLTAGLLVICTTSGINAQECREMHSRSDWQKVTVVEEHLTIPYSGETLHVRPTKNGGVKVDGTSTDGNWHVTVCKTQWQSRLTNVPASDVVIEATEEKLVASSYEENGWSVFFVLQAPQGAEMATSTTNGPVSIRDVTGTFSVESKNGPLSLRDVNGSVVARLSNGPISFENLTGEFDLETRNGPISADFRNTEWRGARIRATTDNGPLSLRSTPIFPAGITVRAEGHGPISCGSECGDLQRDLHGRQTPRVFHFGPSTDDIVLTTDNGPVTIDVK